MSKELITLLDNALPVNDMQKQIVFVQDHMSKNMKEGEHFGVIPGCGDKPTLLKAGAEKLCFIFQLAPSFQSDCAELGNGHREYKTKCTLTHRPSGALVSEAEGSCSTMESKFRFRNSERKCPDCGATAITKGKEQYGGGWLCWAKKGGCGAKFSDGDRSIEGQIAGKVEHDNPADYYNTVLKMAAKRALTAATLLATAASDIFTQDVEDFPDEMRSPTAAKAEERSMNQDTLYPDENPDLYVVQGYHGCDPDVAGKAIIEIPVKKLANCLKPKYDAYTTEKDKVNIKAYLDALDAQSKKQPTTKEKIEAEREKLAQEPLPDFSSEIVF